MNIHDPEVQAFLASNRDKLFSTMPAGSYAIVRGPYHNSNNSNRINTLENTDTVLYHKNENLHWLTGINDPEQTGPSNTAIFVKNVDGSTEFILISTELQMSIETQQCYGVNQFYFNADANLANQEYSRYLSLHANKQRISDANINLRIGQLRMVKSDFEINQLRTITANTSNAIILAMKSARSGMTEGTVQTSIDNHFNALGYTADLSFTTTVSGNHDISGQSYHTHALTAQDFVFINAGASSKGGMKTDITAQFPLNGAFSKVQKTLYEIILSANQQAINAAQIGTPVDAIEKIGIKVLTAGLIELGILTEPLDDRIKENAYIHYFTDKVFRWVGFNLFDPCPYFDEQMTPIKLSQNMAFAISSSLTIPQNIDSPYKGMSMCIRNVLVTTPQGTENLSKVPQTVEAIQNCVAPPSATGKRTNEQRFENNHDHNGEGNNNSNNNGGNYNNNSSSSAYGLDYPINVYFNN